MRLRVLTPVILFSLVLAGEAFALSQPNGVSIPAPMGCANNEPTGLLPVLACACTASGVCNIGAPCPGGSTSCDPGKNGTCETTLWHSPNDNSCIPSNESGLDPATAAQIVPETFHPTCGQTFTVLSRGTAKFENIFGWYNATPGASAPPDPSDLHVMLDCGAAAGTAVTLNVQTDPSYKGGDIGFFLVTPEDHASKGTCAAGNCCPTVALTQSGVGYIYYSQKEFDPDPGYIHLLNMAGTIAPNRFYFAWEDTFQTTSADFTDLVTAVDGVQCSGAGVACNTGKMGVCAQGLTVCQAGSTTPTCQELVPPAPETCDGLDDDCNGVVDNGATCPTIGNVCLDGACVPECGSLENPCLNGLTCDDGKGYCVDPKCVAVTCGTDQVCMAGACITACQGVVCPHGQDCVGNACVDLCKSVACSGGEVCEGGLCFAGCASCGGVTCSAPLSCDAATGACVDSSCSPACGAGTVCQAGGCVDACQGVVCPAGQSCASGQCSAPSSGEDGGITLTDPGSSPNPGVAPGDDAGTLGGNGSNGSNGSNANGFPAASQARAGCGCTLAGARGDSDRAQTAGLLFAALGLGAIASRRRRSRP